MNAMHVGILRRCGALLAGATVLPVLLVLPMLLLLLPLAADAAADKSAVDGELIVQLRERADIAPLLVKHQLSLIGRFGARPIYRLKVIGNASVAAKVDALSREAAVRSVEPNAMYKIVAPDKNVGWAIGDPKSGPAAATQWAASAIRLEEAHRVSTGAGIRIAVIDTGVDRNHPALAGRLLPGFDFVGWDNDPAESLRPDNPTFGHGTHVAGLVAMVAPAARIMPLRVIDDDGYSNVWVLAEAMLHAVDPDGDPSTDDGAHVINLSVGTLVKTELFRSAAGIAACKKTSSKGDETEAEDGDYDDALSAVDRLRCRGFGGALVIAAAGNQGSDKILEYPAAEKSEALLAVAASTAEGWLAGFSNYGWPKIAAPGDMITSALPGGNYGTWSGTSMAAPLVSGAAALLLASDRKLNAKKVIERLKGRGSKLCGTGIKQLDLVGALDDKSPRDTVRCDKGK